MITRQITKEIVRAAAEYPVVTIVGPRQSGKTTLAKMAFPRKPYVSLEEPDIRLAAEGDPRGFLRQFPDGAILDEIQRLPELLSYLQGIVDADGRHGLFVLTGSHQPLLHETLSQSLAGRTSLQTLWPFSLQELRHYRKHWKPYDLAVRGGFPRMHKEQLDTRRFYSNYVQTYVERDVRAMIQLRSLSQFQHFLILLAGRTGQLLNYSSLANDVGVSDATIRNWISILKASYILYELPPYFENIGKRVIKAPKIYFTDTGLATFLLGIHDADQASRDPLRGSLYENLILMEIIKGACNKGIRPELYFFRDSNGNEVDVLLREQGMLYPMEIKSAATFSTHFVKGLMRFRALNPQRCLPGAVLYDGTQFQSFKDTPVFNPLEVDNLWESLISSIETRNQ